MIGSTGSVQIKAFGTVMNCYSEDDLRRQIALKFLLQSISIITTNSRGITTPHFIDVDENGALTYSYSDKTYLYSDFF